VTDEYHQSFVPNRMTDPKDLLVDFLGATAGALAAMRLTDWWDDSPSASSDADRDRPADGSS
jgi:VanZ family protein